MRTISYVCANIIQSGYPPSFLVGIRIAKHIVKDGFGKDVKLLELGILLVDDVYQAIQFRNNLLLLLDGGNRDRDFFK